MNHSQRLGHGDRHRIHWLEVVLYLIALMLGWAFVAYAQPPKVPIARMTVCPTASFLTVATAPYTLKAAPLDAMGRVIKGMAAPTWSSSVPAVASVDSTGTVRAKSEGSTTVIVRFGDRSGTYRIYVVPPLPDGTPNTAKYEAASAKLQGCLFSGNVG